MVVLITTILLFYIYSCLEGIREGYFWHYYFKTSIHNKTNMHTLWTLQRTIVWFMFSVFILVYNQTWVCFIVLPASFPFWHDGCYYATRNNLDGCYPKGFWDFSKTSTAWFTKFSTPFLRTLYFILSIIILMFYIFFDWFTYIYNITISN